MTATFDGSQPGSPAEPPNDLGHAVAPAFGGIDTLSLLQEAVNERVEVEPLTVTVPGGRIRLVCHTDIPERDLRRWQRASLPPEKRKNGAATPLDQNQMTIAVAVLVYCVIRIDVLDKHDPDLWHVVENKATGDPLTFNDEVVLSLFGAFDTPSALIKVFGRESDIVRASQEVLSASGWQGENGDGDSDDPR